MIDLTENEKAILKGGCDSDFDNFCSELGNDYCGTWVFDAIDKSKLDPKSARGVISSLVKKGVVTILDNEGNGKSRDMVVIPTKIGYDACVELGYHKI